MLRAPVIEIFSKANRRTSSGTSADADGWQLSGSAVANSVVSLFDGNRLLGMTTADALGAWIFEAGFDSISSFTAMATDSAGNTSPVSSPFNVAGSVQEAETRQGMLAMRPSLSGAASLSVADTASSITPVVPLSNGAMEGPVSNSIVVSSGGTLEIASPYSGTISFAGATGTLQIDNSASFSGKIAGQLAIGDVIDLRDISAGANATIAYSGDHSAGTLTVSDGTHTASIALLGNYSLANFTVSSDGHGGTQLVDPPLYPDATTTGVPAGVTLTPSGSITINTPGAVISGLDITGSVTINAPNVTLENCRITYAGFTAVRVADGLTGVTVQNCEINGTGANNSGENGIWGPGTFLNNNIYNVENGIVPESGSMVQGNYIHNLLASGSPHYDGIQIDGGDSNITITDNTVYNPWTQTSAVMIDNYFGPISNINVQNNLLLGGGYTIYVDGHFGGTAGGTGGTITGVSITNNHFGLGYYGVTDFNQTNPTFTGNLNDGATLLQGLNQPVTSGPTVTSLTESPATGDLNAGKVVTLTLNMSSAVTVAGGTPTLTLNDGGTATYSGGSGTSALTFSYTVGSTDTNVAALAATAVNLNGATMKDGSGNAASLSLSGITQTGPQIDTMTPTVSSVAASGTGITSGAGDLGTGSVVTLTVNLSEAVTVTGGTPTLTLNDGGTASYTGGSGTKALTFSYTVAAGQNTADLAVTAVNLNSATVTNGAGTAANLSGAVANPAGTLQINTTAPTVSSVAASGTGITSGAGDLGTGSVVTLTVNLSGAVTVAGGTPTLTLNDGGTATYTGGSGSSALTFSYTVAAGQNTPDLTVTAVNLNGATVKDGAGNAANLTGAVTNPSGTLQIDTTAPTVSQVVAAPGTGNELRGNTVTLSLTFSEAVTVSGTPTLTLNDGGTATYTGGSGTKTLSFSYTVGATDSSVSALAVTQANLPNGATIKDGAGNSANLAGAVTTFTGLAVNSASNATSVNSVTESPATGDLNAGKTVTLTLNMSGSVTVNTTGGTPSLTLNDGGTATYTGGSGTNALTFSYTVGTGQNTAGLAATAANLNGATVTDSAGNAASLSLTGLTQTGPQIDTTSPVVSTISETPVSGILNAGKIVVYTIAMSEAVTVNTTGGAPTLALDDGGTATYVSGSGSNALLFSYTVLPGQNTPDLMVSAINLNGASITDGAGNAANLSVAGITQGSPSIDTTPPTVASVTATAGDYNVGKKLTLTLNMSEAVNVTGTPTLTLNDGGTASYVSGSGSSTLTFSYTVGAGQTTPALAVNGITGTIADLAGNALSTSGLPQTFAGVVVDTTAPTVSSVAASGTGITAGTGDLGAGKVVMLTVNLSEAVTVAGGTPTLSLNDGGKASFTGGSGTNALTFSYTVAAGQNTSDLAITAVNLNGSTVNDGAGNAANLSGAVTSLAGTLQIDTTAPTVSSVVTSGTGIKNGAGALGVGAAVTLTVNLSEAATVAGGTPTLSLNDGGTASYTGGSGTNALTFSYTVAAGQSTNDLTVTAFNLNGASVQDGAGNAANLAGAITNPQGKLKIYTGTQKAISTDTTTSGTTSLVALGSTYALNTSGNSAIIGPELSFNGAPLTAGQFGSNWTVLGAVAVTGGYDVAWENTATGLYNIWSVDSSGNYVKDLLAGAAPTSYALESYETTFQQDLNGDGTIGVTTTPVESAGSTSLVEVANNYYLDPVGGGTGPELSFSGAPLIAGQFGSGWTILGAEAVSGGYDVAWKNTATGLYNIWSVDSSGNYVKDLLAGAPSNSGVLQSFEAIFHQDINGDGTIGLAGTTIASSDTTNLLQVGSNYFLEPIGGHSGTELSFGGAPLTAGQFGGKWTILGAVAVTGGYAVAWENTATGLYNIWSVDSGGNYVKDLLAGAAPTSYALESYEATFQQDLNRDGTIGVTTTPVEAAGSTSLVEVANNYYLDPVGGGTGPELHFNGAPLVAGQFGSGWTILGAEAVTGGYDVAWKNTATGLYNIWSVDSSGNYVKDLLAGAAPNSSALQSFEPIFQQDLNGDGVITIPSGQSMELTGSYAGEIAFGGATGTLKVDHAADFTGTVGGPLTPTDQIDFADVNFNSLTLGYSGNNSPGTLTVSDGTHTASLSVLGNHSLANFTASSDGHGGTIVVDPPLTGGPGGVDQQVALLSQYMASSFADAGVGDGAAPVDHSLPGGALLGQLASSAPAQHASMLS